jgi:tRNA U34 5-methylaminomethyl-2-thiouridine-forming methyltransferase MnmC
MSIEIRATEDGSATLFSEKFGETYHSIHGAITESVHVFIDAAFNFIKSDSVNVLEFGFGTGLNAYLTFLESSKCNRTVKYTSLELYPVSEEIFLGLAQSEGILQQECFLKMHECPWGAENVISSHYSLCKEKTDFASFEYTPELYDVVYFDAFSPVTQPELWTKEIFDKVWYSMKRGGVLSTYCAKGEVRRNMKAAGFKVERLPGPPGKREMLRAIK